MRSCFLVVSALLFFFCAPVFSLDAHHRYGGHRRDYFLCATRSGTLRSYKSTSHSIKATDCYSDLARVSFVNSINQTGWAVVDVEVANDTIPDYLQGFAAGYVEGRATRDLITMHYKNTVEGYCRGAAAEYCERLRRFLLRNLLYTREKIATHPQDRFWRQVNVTLSQLSGMVAGFEGGPNDIMEDAQLVAHPLYLMQIPWEVKDLERKLGRPSALAQNPWTPDGHCSALVKVTENNTDLIFSHSTWDSYNKMLRVEKRYRFKLPGLPGSSYTFSGYPGVITFVDDFALSSSKLAIMETTLEYHTKDLLKFISTHTILTWLRAHAATRLANTAEEWVGIFAKHNSGTNNNQWIVVDYKKFVPGMAALPKEGLIYIVELLPGHFRAEDMTAHLEKRRYWPGYNAPYFPEIFNLSNTQPWVDKFGDFFTYEKSPRALIFERDQHRVVDVESMRTLMRSNSYTSDPLSRCACSPPYSASAAIASRADLNPPEGQYPFPELGFRAMGAIDVKITNVEMMASLTFDAVSGPTHDPTPVFSWKTAHFSGNISHVGHPEEFSFPPLRHTWSQQSLYARG